MAAKWKEFEADGDRYNLQYRTAGDERVRASHQRLNNITLPITSKFWDDYLPPNGYGCRCTVVQVRKGKYPLSDEREALNLASQATAGKHQEMMKFNPGKEMTTFPAYNAYTRSKCKNCKQRPGNVKLAANIPDNELCKACKIVAEMRDSLKRQRKEIRLWASENLIGQKVTINKLNSPIEFKMKNIKEILNQPHSNVRAKNEALRNIVQMLKEGEYYKHAQDEKDNPMVKQYHYIAINIKGIKSFAVIRELITGECHLYSIVEKLRQKK